MKTDDNDQSGEDALAALIEVEQRISAEVEAAQQQAAELVESARAAARSLEQETQRLHREENANLRDAIERERREAIAEILKRADASIAHYRNVEEQRLPELADWLISQITDGRADP